MALPVPTPGSVVVIRQRRWHVEHVRRGPHVVRLDVVSRDRRLTFLSPFDRVTTIARRERPRRVRPGHALARLAHLVATAVRHRDVRAAIRAKAEILPHQLEPALAMLAGRRRVLVADDVGLGKTVQAGLVIAEILCREASARVLVLVPAALLDQWDDELRERFGLDPIHADRKALQVLAADGAWGRNPWDRPGVWLASPDFVKQGHVLESLPARPWDLLVLDEAHDACGDSARHDAAENIARRSRRVLLLTATPHCGDAARFDRLLRLGAINGLADPLTVFRRTRADLGVPATRRVRWHHVAPSPAEARVLTALADFERRVIRSSAGRGHEDAALLLLSVFRKRLLSTPTAFRRSLERRREWLALVQGAHDAEWIQPPLGFGEAEDEVGAEDARGLTGAIGLPAGQERSWLRRLCEMAAAAEVDDSKARWVARLLERAREPVVVFTEFRDSLDVLSRRLDGVRVAAILHGDMTAVERRQALARFSSGAASVLLATDVASQGLNLQQRARWVVSLELPWNPVRLEQRAGRVDRIGQRRPVHVSLLMVQHPAEQGLLARLARRVLLARRSLGQDTLRAGLPDESAIRASLLTSTPCPDTTDVTGPPIARRWVRPASRMATTLARRRRLGDCWRKPGPASSSTVCCKWRPVGELRGSHLMPLLIFVVPISDEFGTVVEEQIVPVRSPVEGDHSDPLVRAAVERARGLVARAVTGRVARLQRIVRAEIDAAARVETAIASRLSSQLHPRDVQGGLFDERATRAAEAADADVFDVRATAEARLEQLGRRTRIKAGRPVLDCILGGRQ